MSETGTWLDFALECEYLTYEDHGRLTEKCRAIGRMLGSTLKNPEAFILRP
jgi:four helix bundle protein